MKIVYSPEHLLHAPEHEIYDGEQEPYAEKPKRIEDIKIALERNGYQIIPPRDFDDSLVESIHFQRYVEYLQKQSATVVVGQRFASNYIMDSYTPITNGTYQAARTAANVALTTMEEVVNGSPAYGLCRPPGHHAEPQRMGGYCYFNNAAIAAAELARKSRVAILDIDFHHGNGTQEIFYDRSDVLYISLHATPDIAFPYFSVRAEEIGRGEGADYNLNLPLPKETGVDDYLETLQQGIERISQYEPEYVVLSLGYDTYCHDPIAGFELEVEDYARIGLSIGAIEVPIVLIQEGGYHASDLGSLALSFLDGFRSQTKTS